MHSGDPPDIFQFISYRAFLKAWFEARKHADSRYSHRLFARRAGVRSPSLLGEVIAGQRNLTPATAEGFQRALGLTGEEAAFFAALVQFDQAQTGGEKNDAWERICASRRFRGARALEGGMMRYLSNWYYPAIRELAWCEDFRPDPRWIAARLLPRISEAQARDALRTLQELGMLAEEGGKVRPKDVSLATPHQLLDLGAHNYHRQMLARASEAIDAMEPEDRHLCGVTVAIPRDLVPRLKAELDAFQERLLHLCDAQVGRAEQVVQLGLQLVPLSRGEPR